jgi:hypothetical protein
MNQEEPSRVPTVASVARRFGLPIPLYLQTLIFRLAFADVGFLIELGIGDLSVCSVESSGRNISFMLSSEPTCCWSMQ